MKKKNFWFIGECAIIFALLIVISVLTKDEKHTVQGKETTVTVVGAQEEKAEEALFSQETRKEQEAPEEQEVVKEQETVVIEENEKAANEDVISSAEKDKTKIVVFGDSIWNADRGKDGISELVMEQLDVEIYNCAIGGTTAAVVGETTELSDWESRSFNGMMYIARDKLDGSEVISGDAAYEVIEEVNFDEVDYVIVSYGLNDYFSDVPVYPEYYYDINSYIGALRHGVHKLQKDYPQIEFILTSPTYCEWFSGERKYELGTYVEAARSVAEEMDLHFLDMYHALGQNPNERMEYLEDGVHLTLEGRQVYADSVIEYLKEVEKEES